MLDIINSIPLLSTLPQAEVQRQCEDGQLFSKKYTKGMVLSSQKDLCDTLDIVLSGSFVTYSLAENGSAMQVFEFAKGQMLGANLLFGDSHTYPLTVYCEVDGEILHVSKKAVTDFLHHHDFAMAFIVMLSQNSQRLNQKMRMNLHKTLRENLLDYLENQSRLQQSDTVVLPISKKQLADYLGVQRPSLFRELKKLVDEELIVSKGRSVTLCYCANTAPDPERRHVCPR
ncbi:Crp/Fnr family transcriptional regulator [Ruminococcaceae bacterium OttesenSCG-928-D13]|nr:Crp/Fnr family transcriptional regulator [Ruminococcaceae bacterium OttesenSCG-928-D13]